jgi:hypothetical protein
VSRDIQDASFAGRSPEVADRPIPKLYGQRQYQNGVTSKEAVTNREMSEGRLSGMGGILQYELAGTDKRSPVASSSSSTPKDSKGIYSSVPDPLVYEYILTSRDIFETHIPAHVHRKLHDTSGRWIEVFCTVLDVQSVCYDGSCGLWMAVLVHQRLEPFVVEQLG